MSIIGVGQGSDDVWIEFSNCTVCHQHVDFAIQTGSELIASATNTD
jgi:dihydrodipicolinate reductase